MVLRVHWAYIGIMENQMEKNVENEMEALLAWAILGDFVM